MPDFLWNVPLNQGSTFLSFSVFIVYLSTLLIFCGILIGLTEQCGGKFYNNHAANVRFQVTTLIGFHIRMNWYNTSTQLIKLLRVFGISFVMYVQRGTNQGDYVDIHQTMRKEVVCWRCCCSCPPDDKKLAKEEYIEQKVWTDM